MDIITTVNSWAWGPLMLALLLGTGLYLTLGLRFLPIRKLPAGIRLLLRGGRGQGPWRHLSFRCLDDISVGHCGHRQYRRRGDRYCFGRAGCVVLDVGYSAVGYGH